ncbi:MAG: flagellar motor switch protein FliM [Clostridia bacterium]|nr:flagellar motor switch protein FliM [Clostridia bacterium]
MGDILSQNEIDELLRALNTGEIDVQQMQATGQEKKIKNHDFRRPSKFAKDHLKTLNIIHENYARLVTNFLSGYLRTLVQVDVISVEPLSYYEFNNSISNPVILAVVDFTPLSGSIILEMAPNVAYALIDRILGGKGTSMEKVRGFTEIELAIVERIIIQILNLMREPWENVIAIRPRLEKIETNAQFAQIISPNEIVALVTLSARVGEVEGMINLCIPHMVVEPIVSKLSTKFWFSTVEKETTKETKHTIESKIEYTKVPVRAILGRTVISVNEFIELMPGDVIPLDSSVNGDLEILVGDLLKFYAKPGVKKNKVAMKVSEIVRREED